MTQPCSLPWQFFFICPLISLRCFILEWSSAVPPPLSDTFDGIPPLMSEVSCSHAELSYEMSVDHFPQPPSGAAIFHYHQHHHYQRQVSDSCAIVIGMMTKKKRKEWNALISAGVKLGTSLTSNVKVSHHTKNAWCPEVFRGNNGPPFSEFTFGYRASLLFCFRRSSFLNVRLWLYSRLLQHPQPTGHRLVIFKVMLVLYLSALV